MQPKLDGSNDFPDVKVKKQKYLNLQMRNKMMLQKALNVELKTKQDKSKSLHEKLIQVNKRNTSIEIDNLKKKLEKQNKWNQFR